jgi:hypothetical protein
LSKTAISVKGTNIKAILTNAKWIMRKIVMHALKML